MDEDTKIKMAGSDFKNFTFQNFYFYIFIFYFQYIYNFSYVLKIITKTIAWTNFGSSNMKIRKKIRLVNKNSVIIDIR